MACYKRRVINPIWFGQQKKLGTWSGRGGYESGSMSSPSGLTKHSKASTPPTKDSGDEKENEKEDEKNADDDEDHQSC